ncbi:hypothetical protein [Wenyingzhuangia sp. IMCC45574]
MNFFKKLFNISENNESSKEETTPEKQEISSLDDLFVHNFIEKGGKFIYCVSQEEALITLTDILKENQWEQLSCLKDNMLNTCKQLNINIASSKQEFPFFTSCEHLIAGSGNILLSSNQLGEMKLRDLNENFIVMAYASQIVKNTGEGLTGIKANSTGKLPTNISEIKNYAVENTDKNFMNYGLSNSKNLYLILVEDL